MISLIVLSAGVLAAEPDYSALSADLTALRRQVEQEDGDLAALRSRQESEIRALSEQRAEIEILRQREQLRLGAAQERVRMLAAEQGELDERVTALVPVLDTALADLEAWTASGVPYRAEERTADLSRMRRELASGALDPRTATAQLWQHVEDELQLTEQVGVSRQVVELGEERVLARVAHLGLAAAYFELSSARGNGLMPVRGSGQRAHRRHGRVAHRRYGQAVYGPEGWTWEERDGLEEEAIADLFASLTRGIRSGAFSLPLAPPEEGS